MYRVSKVIERVQEAEKAKNESGGITCSEIERQSERANNQGRTQADDSSPHKNSRR